jgi:hypothetical protein
MNRQRELIYKQRNQVLDGEELKPVITRMIEGTINEAVDFFCSDSLSKKDWNIDGLRDKFKGWLTGPDDFKDNFDKEEAILYTMNSKGYRFEGNPDTEENKALNKKTIRLRWLHEFENGDIHVINDDTNIGDFEVRWYRFKLGNPSADEYSGVYWEHIPNDESSVFDFSFVPKYNLESE